MCEKQLGIVPFCIDLKVFTIIILQIKRVIVHVDQLANFFNVFALCYDSLPKILSGQNQTPSNSVFCGTDLPKTM